MKRINLERKEITALSWLRLTLIAAAIASHSYAGDISSGGTTIATPPLANRVATRKPPAPDLEHAFFIVERLPVTEPGSFIYFGAAPDLTNQGHILLSQLAAPGGYGTLVFDASGVTTTVAGYEEFGLGRHLNESDQFVADVGDGNSPDSKLFHNFGPLVIEERSFPGLTLQSINNHGTLLATQPDADQFWRFGSYFGSHFVINSNGLRIPLSLPTELESGAYLYSISDAGEVIGSGFLGEDSNYWQRAVYFGPAHEFHYLAGNGIYDEAFAINQHGQIVGVTSSAYSNALPAYWENYMIPQVQVLPMAPRSIAPPYTWANDINKWGQIVGFYEWFGGILWLNKQEVDLSKRIVNPDNLDIGSFNRINDTGEILGMEFNHSPSPPPQKTFIMRPAWAILGVDANRDGVLTFGNEEPSDTTTAEKPFRFWINDDDDTSAMIAPGVSAEADTVPAATPDYLKHKIISKRNLEDFARLQIWFSGVEDAVINGQIMVGLKWKDGYTGTPAINIYQAADVTGSDAYLKDDTPGGAAQAQITGDFNNAITDVTGKNTVDTTGTFVFKSDFWTGLSTGNQKKYLLFEGAGIGSGQLAIVLLKVDGTVLCEASNIWFELKSVKSMYLRVQATADGAANFPFPYNYVAGAMVPTPTMGWIDDSNGYSFTPAAGESNNYIVFVHGWNEEYGESMMYAETMYKRMVQLGYNGRFVLFRWPTFTGIATYNDSEYRAWLCGESLKQYLATVPVGEGGYVVNIVAHSMGNIVAGSALAKGATVTNYALLNAAVPACAYDTGSYLAQTSWGYVTPNDDSDPITASLSYQGRLNGIGGYLINFSLSADTALSLWEINNDSPGDAGRYNVVGEKPHQFADGSLNSAGYFYSRGGTPGQKLTVVREAGPRVLTDSSETMAFAVQSPTLTVGADKRTRGSVAENVDLADLDYNFGSEHSAEFLFTAQETRLFYTTLLRKFDILVP